MATYEGAVDIVLTAEECRSIIVALRSTYLPGAPFGRWTLADRVADAIDDAAYHADLGPDGGNVPILTVNGNGKVATGTSAGTGASIPKNGPGWCLPVPPTARWPYPVPAVLWDAVLDMVQSERDGGQVPAGWTPDATVAIRWAQRGYVDASNGTTDAPDTMAPDDCGAEIAYWAGYNLARDHAMGAHS